jgi:hypothetical protein
MNEKLKKLTFLIYNQKYIYALYIIAAVASALSKYFLGSKNYNNYLIFKNVIYNTIHEQNLYSEYPQFHLDVNHYGILFSALIAPFSIMPDWLGMILWNIANVSIFIYAITQLPFTDKLKAFFAWLCFQELITSLVSFQFNITIAAIILLSASFIYQRKETQSVLAILIGTFVKIYGIVGLSSFFFVKNKTKFIVSFIIIALLCVVFPMLYTSPHFVLNSYNDWFVELIKKNEKNQTLGILQDISFMGFIRRILGDSTISNLFFLKLGLPLFFIPYLRIKQYKHRAFQLLILSSTLLFTVLFSSGSESSTYIIAVSGVMIWFIIQEKKSNVVLALFFFVLILTCFGMSDLFPKFIKKNYIIKYSLKALPCTIVWFRIIYELMTRDFSKHYIELKSYEKN